MQVIKNLFLFSLSFSTAASVFANAFVNGDFETGLSNWTLKGYLFTGYAAGLVLPPKSISDITLQATTPTNGISDVVTDPVIQSKYDYFLFGATPTTTLKLPESGLSTAVINLKPYNAVSGTSQKPNGWTKYGKLATSISQKIISPSDEAHIRFKLAAVMENPDHTAKQQPFYAVQVNNLTQGRSGSNPVFFQWSYSAQAGVPWDTISKAGTNSGSNATYSYLDWQNFDITVTGSKTNDELELIVLAAGCSPGGHDGHIYLDGVTTDSPSAGLIINATGPASIQAGQSITYIYNVTNYNSSTMNNVCVEAHMPQTQNTNPPYETVYLSSSNISGFNPTRFSYDIKTNILTACADSLSGNGAIAQFQMTVNVPENWQPSFGPINNGHFPVHADNYNPVLGNLVQTNMTAAPPTANNSYLVIDLNGLKINGQDPFWNFGDPPYSGTYTCTNVNPGNVSASPASCEINNLPDGLTVTGCRKNGNPWTSPYTINLNEVVTCTVEGTPTSSISREYILDASTNAANNINSVSNYASIPFYIYNNPVAVPATLNDSTVLTPVRVCCGRPVAVYDLPIESDLPSTFEIIATSGNVKCRLEEENGKNIVKLFGRPGTCTVLAYKDNQISQPLILQSS